MTIEARTVDEYISKSPPERQEALRRLRKEIKSNLPDGFEETINYGMIGFVVPLSRYPAGYLDNKDEPLPFINVASQKNHIAVYHLGTYSFPELLKWFEDEYAKSGRVKLDMGKRCIRFRKPDHIPYELIGELASRITVDEWIEKYEYSRKK